jgi:hypothetical protein
MEACPIFPGQNPLEDLHYALPEKWAGFRVYGY